MSAHRVTKEMIAPSSADLKGSQLVVPVDLPRKDSDGQWQIFHTMVFDIVPNVLIFGETRIVYHTASAKKIEKHYSRPREGFGGKVCTCSGCKAFFKRGMKDKTEVVWSL